MTGWTTLRYAVIDVEGNGQRPPDLVELSIVPIIDGIIETPVSWLLRPELPITVFARRIHGITNEQVADADTFSDVADAVRKELAVDALVAHNAHVDVGVMQRKLGEWECPEIFDTLKLARRLLPGRDSYKLATLATDLSLTGDLGNHLQPHRAEYDATVCARLFIHLAGRHTLDELRGKPADQPDGVGARSPVQAAIAELARSDQWRHVPAMPGVTVYVRVWEPEGSSETITIRGDDDAEAIRVNAYGQRVYRAIGAVLDVITEISGLAAPGTPSAPVQVIGLEKPPLDDGIYEHVEVPDHETP